MNQAIRVTWVAVAVVVASGCAAQAVAPDSAAVEQESMAAARVAERQGNLNQALVEYVKVLAVQPDNADVHFRVGQIHSGLGEKTIAGEAYQRTLALKPDHAGALEGLGLLMLERGDHLSAHQMLHKAAARDERRWPVFNGLGVLADLEGKHGLAQAYFRHALSVQPTRAEILNNLGYSLYLAGDSRGALEYFQRALQFDPDYGHAWSNVGLLMARSGNYDRAVQAFSRLMDEPAALYSTGYICYLDGRLDDAERLFSRAIQASPSYYDAAHKARARVREARAQAAAGKDR